METVQLSLGDASYAMKLRNLLTSAGSRDVRCVGTPDAGQEGVIVVDAESLSRLPFPLPHPERVVLITHNDAQHLSAAWNAGIRSVLLDADSLNTAVLAIMAAGLRVQKGEQHCALSHSSPKPVGSSGACEVCDERRACAAEEMVEPVAGASRGSRPEGKRGEV